MRSVISQFFLYRESRRSAQGMLRRAGYSTGREIQVGLTHEEKGYKHSTGTSQYEKREPYVPVSPSPSPSQEFIPSTTRPLPHLTYLYLLPFFIFFPGPLSPPSVCSTGSSTLPSLAHDSSVPRSQPSNLSVCILPLFFGHSLPYPLFSLRPVPSKPVCNASVSLIPLLPPILSGRAASLLFLLHLRWFSFARFSPFRLADTSALPRGVQSNHTALLAQVLVFIF